jgi:asparagine synthase (glutamine-hydrolysing)
MSGIAGIYNLDGRPVDPTLLRRMTDAIFHRGPDGINHWINGSVGLGHCMLQTTPESLHENQPLTNETGELCLTLDGRVDNRRELKAELEAKDARLRDDTDAELVLKAYEVWGEKSPEKILGDFAYLIWDGRNQQLFCARDILGKKPFYYYTDGRTVLCGSELHQLFEDASVPREPNEGMVGEYLADAVSGKEETLFRGIFRLPPAHFLLVRRGVIQKERYWDIDLLRQVRYLTDDEYAEHFFEIFKEAVRCRLRSHRPVGSDLSGGLDSSSVVGMAQTLYRDGGAIGSGFETFSVIFPGLPCDESSYIHDVVRMWDHKSNEVCPDNFNPACFADEVRRYKDLPQSPNGVITYPLLSLAREKGIRVILTGGGGDEWLTGSYYHYADFLRELKIFSLIRQIRYDRQFDFDSGVPAIVFPPLYLMRVGLFPLAPQAARRAIKWALRRNGGPPWINEQFADRIHLSERLRTDDTKLQFTSFAQKDLYSYLRSGSIAHTHEMGTRPDSWFQVEKRDPLHDRRIIEFALALPEEQRWRRTQPKFILRQAMQGLLPETVRQRLTKADFSHVFPETLQALGGERLFNSLAIESMGWVNGSQVRAMYQQMSQCYARADLGYLSYIWKLWTIFAIELWVNTVLLNRQIPLSEERPIKEENARLFP